MDRMTIIPAFFCMLSCICAPAQDNTGTIRGLIRDSDGNSIEYVSVGIPGSGIGTVSDSCGRFSLYLPPEHMQDSIIFMHVSYRERSLPASMLLDRNGTATITLAGNELHEAVIRPAGTHRRRLVKRGVRIAGGSGVMSANSLGHEVGTRVRKRKRFRVDRISFTVLSNAIPDCVLGMNIYRTDTSGFKNILTEPIYCRIPVSVSRSEYVIEPQQNVTLEPGEYFIALALVDATLPDGTGYPGAARRPDPIWAGGTGQPDAREGPDRQRQEGIGQADVQWPDSMGYPCGTGHPDGTAQEYDGRELPRLEFPLYLKPSWMRERAVQEPEPVGVNIGLVVEGTE